MTCLHRFLESDTGMSEWETNLPLPRRTFASLLAFKPARFAPGEIATDCFRNTPHLAVGRGTPLVKLLVS